MPDGTMYMGTINGMIAFNPRDFKEDVYSPSVCITRIDVQDDRIGAPKYNVNQIMKNGELIQEGTEKEITDKVEGCVWKCIVSEKEAGQITSSLL